MSYNNRIAIFPVPSELTLSIRQTILWSDSTTVLSWIQSDSSQYKVFVRTRNAEIQEHTDISDWGYVPSEHNPADDDTRGKSLHQLTQPSRWNSGLDFLYDQPAHWPSNPAVKPEESDELRKSTFCSQLTIPDASSPDLTQDNTWSDLLEATHQSLHGAAAPPMSASDHLDIGVVLLKHAQADCFPEELNALRPSHPQPPLTRV